MISHALSRMMRAAALVTLAVTVVACGTRQPAPDTRQWVAVGEEPGHRGFVDPASIRRNTAGVRAVTYAVDHAQPQDRYETTFDREELSVEFDCARHAVRTRGGIAYLRGALAWAMDEGPNEAEWEDVAPGTLVAAAMRHVCRTEP